MDEIWKTIPGFSKYEVSNLGNIRSYAVRGNKDKIAKSPKPIKQANCDGYKFVNISNDDKKIIVIKVHSLVLLSFVGPRPDGLVVCHNNDIKNDNRLENLRYDTQKKNMSDYIENNGGIHGRSSIKLKEVHGIIEDLKNNILLSEITEKYNVSRDVVYRIARKESYKYIDREILQPNTFKKRRGKIVTDLYNMYLIGRYTYGDLAVMFDVSISFVNKAIRYQRKLQNKGD